MKLAIMQPYFFPYIGYFQLIYSVDKFIFYDDVNYIKQGWINRNRLLVNGGVQYFTVPLSGASPFKKINEVEIDASRYSYWKSKFFKTIEQNYKKAPYYYPIYELVREVLDCDYVTIDLLAKKSIRMICDYMGLRKEMIDSSTKYDNQGLKGADRVIDMCKLESVKTYINAEGGKSIYSKEYFSKNHLELKFIRSIPLIYSQFSKCFIPFLSVIDLLMHTSNLELTEHLNSFVLID